MYLTNPFDTQIDRASGPLLHWSRVQKAELAFHQGWQSAG